MGTVSKKALGPGGQVMLNKFLTYKPATNVACKIEKENRVGKPEMRVLGVQNLVVEEGDGIRGGEEKGKPFVAGGGYTPSASL